jgi:hypothetical protein
MHELEPFYNWRHHYIAAEDINSPFHGQTYSEIYFTHAVYNYLIHPQWDEFGSATLYLKVLQADYKLQYAVIEFIGEWNDLLYNDIMFLYRNVIEDMIDKGIIHFILIGENILNFHADGDDYYQEWFDNIDDGWIVCLNFRDHIINEFTAAHLDYYLGFGGKFDEFNWRALEPDDLFKSINALMMRRLTP